MIAYHIVPYCSTCPYPAAYSGRCMRDILMRNVAVQALSSADTDVRYGYRHVFLTILAMNYYSETVQRSLR